LNYFWPQHAVLPPQSQLLGEVHGAPLSLACKRPINALRMPIPISYNLRNLRVRRLTTLMTALAAALSVLVLIAVLALVAGLKRSFEISASPKHLILMRSGSTSELVSLITRKNFQDVLSRPGIAEGRNGRPLASLEMVTVVTVSLPEGREMNVNLRGITATGWEMRPQLRLTSGRLFEPGAREIVVGEAIADRCPAAHVGGSIPFGDTAWRVVGIVSGGQSAFNSEIFGDLNQVSSEYHRFDLLSSVLVGSKSPDLAPLARSLREDRRLNLLVQSERDYYQAQMSAAIPVRFMGTIVALVMALGGAFASMNTMYTAIARRSSEIGILRVLGFSRASVLLSFLLESVLISLLGGALGCLLALPLNRVETAIGSFNTWNQISFHLRVTPEILLTGLAFAASIGAVGGFLPARSAARKSVIATLRAR
jgi:putative ABC transport system permease protein